MNTYNINIQDTEKNSTEKNYNNKIFYYLPFYNINQSLDPYIIIHKYIINNKKIINSII